MSTLPKQLPLLADRVCSVCHVAKPIDQYYVKDKRTGRLHSWCKECHAVKTRAWQQTHRERVAELARLARARNPEAARQYNAKQYRIHAETIKRRARERNARPEEKIKQAAYRTSHAEEIKAYNAQYRLEHAEDIRQYNAAYYRENTEAVLKRIRAAVAKNPDKYRAIHTDWKRNNKDAVNASTHKRRSRLQHNGGTWTAEDWERLKARYDWRCLRCDKQEVTDGIVLCFDHVIPLSLGGFNIISNGQCLCRSCNSIKSRTTVDYRPA